MTDANEKVHAKLIAIYDSLYRHNGFGEMTVEVRILKKQQKEVIIKCGKQFRFVVDWKNVPCPGDCPLCDHGSDTPAEDALSGRSEQELPDTVPVAQKA